MCMHGARFAFQSPIPREVSSVSSVAISISLAICAASPPWCYFHTEEVGAAVAQKCADDAGQSSEVRVAL